MNRGATPYGLRGTSLVLPNGTLENPAIRLGRERSGLYRSGDGKMSLSLKKVRSAEFSGDGVAIFNDLAIGRDLGVTRNLLVNGKATVAGDSLVVRPTAGQATFTVSPAQDSVHSQITLSTNTGGQNLYLGLAGNTGPGYLSNEVGDANIYTSPGGRLLLGVGNAWRMLMDGGGSTTFRFPPSGWFRMTTQAGVPVFFVDETGIRAGSYAPGSIHGDNIIQPSTVTGNGGLSAIGSRSIHANRLELNTFNADQVDPVFTAQSIHGNKLIANTIPAGMLAANSVSTSNLVQNAIHRPADVYNSMPGNVVIPGDGQWHVITGLGTASFNPTNWYFYQCWAQVVAQHSIKGGLAMIRIAFLEGSTYRATSQGVPVSCPEGNFWFPLMAHGVFNGNWLTGHFQVEAYNISGGTLTMVGGQGSSLSIWESKR